MDREPFSNRDLARMIVPLFFEQLLVMLVGLADTFFISQAGEAAVAGVSLVNQFNTVFIFLFTALAAGGAVVVSQYVGSGDRDRASEAASQLLMFSTVFSLVMTAVVLLFARPLLSLMFGRVEQNVMDACLTYLRISALSYPALAIYNAGAALFRSVGKTSVTMVVSIISNVVNVVGNYIGIFVLHAGVAGVAWPSFAARTVSAIAICWLAFKETDVCYRPRWIFAWNGSLLAKIGGIAVPNGAENAIFQLTKVALSSIVALFGTYQIAANGVAQSIWSLAALAGSAFGPVFITVIGQCMGAGDVDSADRYFVRLMRITLIFSVVWNVLVFVATPFILRFYALEPQTISLVIQLVALHNTFNALVFPFSGCLGNGLRATGDVAFTMWVSIICTLAVRLVLSYVLGVMLGMGVMGIAWAMCADWLARAVALVWRWRSGAWKSMRVV
ncbi:MAG: MATE family efflux transporter [Atopobiaceae bacterium]|nr:MATE family efflux transporter [Atopobiaceae bacterium]